MDRGRDSRQILDAGWLLRQQPTGETLLAKGKEKSSVRLQRGLRMPASVTPHLVRCDLYSQKLFTAKVAKKSRRDRKENLFRLPARVSFYRGNTQQEEIYRAGLLTARLREAACPDRRRGAHSV